MPVMTSIPSISSVKSFLRFCELLTARAAPLYSDTVGNGAALLRKRWAKCAAAAVAAMAMAAGVLAVWRASRAIGDAAARVAGAGDIPFTSAAVQPSSYFEPIAAPAAFRDATIFFGELYLCGPSGLFVYRADGSLRARYRAGAELPGAPIALSAAPASRELLIATSADGLLVYDGRTFHQVAPVDTRVRKFTSVLALATGRVLLGTETSGVLTWDGRRMTAFHPALARMHVTALAGTESDLWAGTIDRGVFHWRGGRVEVFGEAEGLPDPHVLSIAVNGAAAYVGTPLGIAEFVDGRFRRAIGPGVFAHALAARGETLYAGTLQDGVIEIPLSAQRARPGRRPDPGATSASIERLIEIDGVLHAVTARGLFRVDGGWREVAGPDTAVLADRDISALAFDSGGRLWTGYFDRGLDILETDLARATHIENEHVFCVNRIVHLSGGGGAAVATANGLVLFDAAGKQRETMGRAEGLIADQVTDVLPEPSGGMVVATPAGLTFLDAGGARSLYAFHGLVNNHVYVLAAAGDRVFAGTLGGLSVLERGIVRAGYTTANSGLRHNWITAIVASGETEWLVGTYGAGVLRFDGAGRWETFPDLPAGLVVNPNAMLATERAVYAGTLGAGLYIYDRASGRWSNMASGLPSENVTALAARGGYVYAGTDNGLVRFAEPH